MKTEYEKLTTDALQSLRDGLKMVLDRLDEIPGTLSLSMDIFAEIMEIDTEIEKRYFIDFEEQKAIIAKYAR